MIISQKNILFATFTLSIVISINVLSQNGFQKTYGGSSNDVLVDFEQTIDNGLMLLGYTNSYGNGGNDIVLSKVDLDGFVLWSKLYGNTGDDRGHDLKRLNNGDYLISGHTTSSGVGGDDIYILRVNSNGNLLWSITFGGNDWEQPRGKAVETSNGDIIIISTTLSFGLGGKDIHFLKMSSTGEMLKSITLGGGSDNDWIHDYIQLSNNSIIIGGRLNHTSSGSFGGLICIDIDGNILWAKSYNTTGFCKFYRLKEDNDGNILAVGRIDSYGAGNADLFVVKTTPEGDLIWAKTYGGPNYELANGIDISSDQKIIFSGYTESFGNGNVDILLIKIDNDGSFIWGKTYGGSNEDYIFCGSDLLNFNNSAYFLNGRTKSFGAGNNDMYLIKTDLSGTSGCNEQDFNPIITTPPLNDNPIQIFQTTAGEQGTPNTIIIDFILPSITLCPDLNPYPLFTTENTVICKGDCITFIDTSLYNPTSWNWYFEGAEPSASNVQNPNNICYQTPGSFDVGLIVSNQYGTDSLLIENYITVLPIPDINIGPDTLLCQGDSLIINAGGNYISYIWNTGSTDSLIVVNSTGLYFVEVTNEFGCSAIDSIIVEIYPMAFEELELGPDATFCSGENFILNAGSGYTFYQWQDGSSDSIFIADTAGVYWVYVENPCSSGSDTIVLDLFPLTEIDLGKDTALCHDESILLDPGFGYNSYLWQNGATNQFLYANQTGSYWVEVVDENGCPAYDTISLDFVFPNPEIGSDTAICSGDSVTFQASAGFVNYLWQNGSDLSNLTTGNEGPIWCKVTDTIGCVGSDTAFVSLLFPPEISLGNDTSFCMGDSLYLNITPWNNSYSYHWEDGSTDSVMMVWTDGNYWVTATNVCGFTTDSVLISVNQLPFVFIGNDTILSLNDKLELDAGEGFKSYFWSDDSELQTIIISEGGSYWVNVFDGQCYNTDTIHIEPIDCDLFIPIVFTPNMDGFNDYFYAESSKDIIDFDLTLFTRWGEVIWETSEKADKWDGNYKGRKADDGTYFWVLQYKCLGSDQQFEKKGSLTLLR